MAKVFLTSCETSFQAEVIKGALEANGILSIIQGENFANVYGQIPAFSPNILVDEADLEKAKQVLDNTVE